MKVKKDDSLKRFIIISMTMNVICLIIIIVIAYKLYKSKNSQPKISQPPKIDSQTKIEKQTIQIELKQQVVKQNNNQTQVADKEQTGIVKDISQIKTLAPSKIKEEEKIQIQRILQTMETPKIITNVVSKTQLALKQQISLEQQRSKYLQQQIQALEDQLTRIRKQSKIEQQIKPNPIFISTQQSLELVNLRNELQFCQNRLLQSYQTEKQLKQRIQAYQKIGQYSLNHPEFQRLRQMNTKYKNIIANLQKYLLDKNNNPLNISFNDL